MDLLDARSTWWSAIPMSRKSRLYAMTRFAKRNDLGLVLVVQVPLHESLGQLNHLTSVRCWPGIRYNRRAA